MKLSKSAFLFLTGLFLTFSCVSQDDIKNLQNQIDTIKDSEISSINKQLKSITTSLWVRGKTLCLIDKGT